MGIFEPAERRWKNVDGQLRTSVHARSGEALKVLDVDGRPTVRLESYHDELWLVDSDELLVNADAKGLMVQGIYGFDARGLNETAVELGNFAPGAQIELVREPENSKDKDAIGIRTDDTAQIAGYVGKPVATGLARAMDDGVELATLCLRGAPAGESSSRITVLVAESALMEFLRRNL